MVQAPVGFQCPDCARVGRQKVYTTRNIDTLSRPYVTFALIGVNVAVFLLDYLDRATCRGYTVSQINGGLFIGPSRTCDGAYHGLATGEWWRLVTSGFVHFGVVHLALNMLALWVVGSQLENAIGRWKYLGLYVVSLLAGSFLVVAFEQQGAVSAGASGAVFGLFGVAFVYQRSLGIDPWRSGIAGIILINLVFTFAAPGISWQAHVGGLVGGAVSALVVFWIERQLRSAVAAYAFCAAASLILFFSALYLANSSALS
jgi:membrane associated rhomboid family serine protease